MSQFARLLAEIVPEQHPDVEPTNPTPYLLLMLFGFVVGAVGHLVRSRTLVAIGVLAVFMGTVLLPIGIFLARS
ncbi:MAG: hypothetical protein ACJ76S_01050 [Solirubrobacteraceae bacterium]